MRMHDGPFLPSHWMPSGERQLRILLALYHQGGEFIWCGKDYMHHDCPYWEEEFTFTTVRGLYHKGLATYSWPPTEPPRAIKLTERGKRVAEYLISLMAGERVSCRVIGGKIYILKPDAPLPDDVEEYLSDKKKKAVLEAGVKALAKGSVSELREWAKSTLEIIDETATAKRSLPEFSDGVNE